MAEKLITLNNQGQFEEVNLIYREGKYLADKKGFPIVINNQGNFVLLDEYDIVNGKLIVYSYGGDEWDFKHLVPYSDINKNSRGSTALRFILED